MRTRLLTFPLLIATSMAQDAHRHPAGSADQGLPIDPLRFAPYDQDPEHPRNRAWRMLWLQQMVPAEVAAVLPRGPELAWTAGWVHQKRAGSPDDRRWFGGDGRQLPLETLSAEAVTELQKLLASMRGAADDSLASPELAVSLQHDLLRAAQRLTDTKQLPDLAADLFCTAQTLALAPARLRTLSNPLTAALATEAMAPLRDLLPTALGGTDAHSREVLRRSTRLFDAERTLLWSRVFLAHPEGDDALSQLLPTHDKGPNVPIGMRAVLVQGIVALAADGTAFATPIVVDVRTQLLQNRDGLSAQNATFSHDGIDFGIWQLEREALRRGTAATFFRHIEPDDQDLFRDYGTSKHTTYRGQCSLCHRVTDTPEPQLGGFPVLRPHAKAEFATTGAERLRLAEEQATKWLHSFAR